MNDMTYELRQQRVGVTGGAGFLGRRVAERLRERGVTDIFIPRSNEFDLTSEQAVSRLFDTARPTTVIHLAAGVGGLGANGGQPGRFF